MFCRAPRRSDAHRLDLLHQPRAPQGQTVRSGRAGSVSSSCTLPCHDADEKETTHLDHGPLQPLDPAQPPAPPCFGDFEPLPVPRNPLIDSRRSRSERQPGGGGEAHRTRQEHEQRPDLRGS